LLAKWATMIARDDEAPRMAPMCAIVDWYNDGLVPFPADLAPCGGGVSPAAAQVRQIISRSWAEMKRQSA